MSDLPDATLQAHLDSLAAQYALCALHLGDGTGATSVSAGAASILASVLALDDYDQEIALLAAAKALSEQTKVRSGTAAYGNTAALRMRTYLDALNVLESNDLNQSLTDRAIQVHPNFDRLWYDARGVHLSRANVFPEVTVLGTITRGESQTVFVAGADLDPNQGPAQLEVEVTHDIGAENDWVLTLTCKKLDNSTEQKVVTVPKGSEEGDTIDVGTADNIYIDVTACAGTGGQADDACQVQTKLLREVALIVA